MLAAHATKGGMLEKHNQVFAQLGYQKLRQGWEAYVKGEMDAVGEMLFDNDMMEIAYAVTEAVAKHTARLSGIDE
ncbi:MAG: hypothetical protein II930_08170 [Lachnospiraceae bacterium]|nr:hypothetical protein [Lachnospiraceae bacterium]